MKCECVKTFTNPFSIGGVATKQEQCHKRARWVAKQGKEIMNLCGECKEVFAKRNEGDKSITIEELK